jgi:hypothetical protein
MVWCEDAQEVAGSKLSWVLSKRCESSNIEFAKEGRRKKEE